MAANKSGRRGRKRKQPDSIKNDEPKAKRRKVVDYKKHNISASKDKKSQSEEPKVSDPFQHTVVPSITFAHNRCKRSRRYSEYPSHKDEIEDDEATSDEDEDEDRLTSAHNTPLRPKYASHRSQPSTPARGITMDKKPELSQSVKKLSRRKPYAHSLKQIHSPIRYNIDEQKMHRQCTPGLYSSQDSISFSPQNICSPMKHKMVKNTEILSTTRQEIQGETYETHVIPVAATPLRRSSGSQHEANKQQKAKLSAISKERCNFLLFACIGFIVGFIVCAAVYHENKLNITANTKSFHLNALCTCDINTNTSSPLCRPCIDQYFLLESQCEECHEQNRLLQIDINKFETAAAKLKGDCAAHKDELRRYQSQNKGLQQTIERIQNGNSDDAKCKEQVTKIKNLEHELGECHVEWGSCEQLGRQKDKLDEKRVEEIEKQKNKFSLCNEQLKRYKEEIKQRNRK